MDRLKNILASAAEGKANDFASAVHDELNARIMDSIENRRIEIADSIFAKDFEEIDMGSVDSEVDDVDSSDEE